MIERVLSQVRNLRWALKRGRGVGVIAIVLLLGAGAGWGVRKGQQDPVRDEVRGAALLLRTDFGSYPSNLGPTYTRRFLGMRGGGVVGEVAKVGRDGRCWRFEIYFPKTWLAGGNGSIEVGDVYAKNDSVCSPGLTSGG